MVAPARRTESRFVSKIRVRIEERLKKRPTLYRLAGLSWRTGTWILFRCKVRLALLFNEEIRNVNIEKTFFLSPEKIVYCSLREFQLRDFIGAVIGGDWDQLELKFEDLDTYIAFKEVFTEKKDWNETAFYRRIVDALNKGDTLWACTNENDFQQRCKDLEKLFNAIKKEGYKTQLSLSPSAKVFRRPHTIPDEVTVSIGRHGDFLYSDGQHRLSIAKLLGLKEIPVQIAVRHKDWMTLRGELFQYAKSLGGKLYQPAMHPDLQDIPARAECENRFMIVKENMSEKRGSLLDIGTNLGYFCHRFEEEGFDCYAVEYHQPEIYFLRKLQRAGNKKFQIIAGNICDWPGSSEIYFDVVLALNIFHHFLKTEESYHLLVALLKNLQMGELFFEPHNEDEPQMKGAYKNYSPSEFVDFIMQVSGLKHAEIIGKSKEGRSIYKLTH